MKKMFRLVLLAVLCSLLAKPLSAFADNAPVKGQMTFLVTLDTKEDAKNARIWLPLPVTDTYQTIDNVKIDGNYHNHGTYMDKESGTMILYADWTSPIKEQKQVTLSFNVTANERNRKDAQEKGSKIPADVKKFLGETASIPTGGKVMQIAMDATKGKNNIAQKARAAYDWVVDHTCRDNNVAGCGTGDVQGLLEGKGGKCVDISSVYVSVARAAGVPTREVFGIRLGKEPGVNDVTKGHHCWVEYYLPGTGWVPVDPADVRKKILDEKLDNKKAEIDRYREFYFNGLDKYRISLSTTDRQVTLTPKQSDGPLNYFMYPYAEVDGKAVEWLAAQKDLKYKVTFTAQQ